MSSDFACCKGIILLMYPTIIVLNLCRSQGAREHYFKKSTILNNIIDALYNWKKLTAKQFKDIICAICFLAQIVKVKDKYFEKSEKHDRFSPFTEPEECVLAGMKYERLDQIMFVVNGEKISASKSTLVSVSDIFGAMLEGNYSEASLSEITIKGSSSFAFRYLIHSLHGCVTDRCKTLKELYTMPATDDSARKVISLFKEADKYLIDPLKCVTCKCLRDFYTVPKSAASVFRFAVLLQKQSLMKASVASILTQSKDLHETVQCSLELMESKYSDIFLQSLSDMLVE